MWRALGCCVVLACGSGAKQQAVREPSPVVTPSAVGAVEMEASALEPSRIAGEPTIVPNDLDRMNLPVGTQVRGRFQLCLDETGKPASVAVADTTGIATYDRKIVDRMWSWGFNPILVDGKPTKVCSLVIMQFEQTKPVEVQRR